MIVRCIGQLTGLYEDNITGRCGDGGFAAAHDTPKGKLVSAHGTCSHAYCLAQSKRERRGQRNGPVWYKIPGDPTGRICGADLIVFVRLSYSRRETTHRRSTNSFPWILQGFGLYGVGVEVLCILAKRVQSACWRMAREFW